MGEQACNLRCDYCYVTQRRELGKKVNPFIHLPEYVAASLSKERLGGTSLITVCCDGEPLISDDIVQFIKLVLQNKNYVYLISNGTVTKSINDLCTLPRDELNRLFIRFSFHYTELKKRNLLETFFGNIVKLYNAGVSISLLLVGSDEYIPYLDEINELSIKYLGALPHIDMVRDEKKGQDKHLMIDSKLSVDEYLKFWEKYESVFFKVKEDSRILHKGGICTAGKNIVHMDMISGDISRCPWGEYVDNAYEDISREIHFWDHGKECQMEYCGCSSMFFGFGVREDYYDFPTAYELWNRTTADGKNWIHDEAKAFLSQKFDKSQL